MERLSQSLSGRCIATAPIGDGLAVAASAGQARRGGTSTLVGQRLPFAPPTSAIFKAWSGATEIDRWLAQASRADSREAARTAVATVRERGYSIGLLSEAQRTFSARLEALGEGAGHGPELDELLDGLIYDPVVLDEDILAAIRLISAPVFAPSGEVVLALTLFDFGKPTAKGGIRNYIAKAVRTAADVTTILGGKRPAASTAPR
jgi:DNA-binding IclR family transcriptional regulator